MSSSCQPRVDRHSSGRHRHPPDRIAGSEPLSQKDNRLGLVGALKNLVIGASGSSKNHQNKPLPPVPPRPPTLAGRDEGQRQTTGTSLPPYLAHLTDDPLPPSRPAPSFPQPSFTLCAPHGISAAASGRHAVNDPNIDPSRLPPRPPTLFSPDPTQRPQTHARTESEHPTSLIPAAIPLGSSTKQPYPWELVPQARPNTASSAPAPSSSLGEKENRGHDSASTTASGIVPSKLNPATPPRKQHARPDGPSAVSPAGSLTPTGLQKDPSHPPLQGQCWGITKDGTRCTRKVRTPTFAVDAGASPQSKARKGKRGDRGVSAPARLSKGASASDPLVIRDSDSDDDDAPGRPRDSARAASAAARGRSSDDLDDCIDEVYCFQHVAEVNKTPGFYASTSKANPASQRTFVSFRDWFTTVEINALTQALLRKRMAEPLTDADRVERGYIYIYELRDRSTATHLCLKVGRATNVFRRLGEWRSQCQSKDPLLRSFHPSASQQGVIPGIHSAGVSGVPLSHRWEALVHVELRGIGHRIDEVCRDCGTRHRELFMIPRWLGHRDESHRLQQNGFDLVERVVLKWMRFVQSLQ